MIKWNGLGRRATRDERVGVVAVVAPVDKAGVLFVAVNEAI
jgi:hypothetical protein